MPNQSVPLNLQTTDYSPIPSVDRSLLRSPPAFDAVAADVIIGDTSGVNVPPPALCPAPPPLSPRATVGAGCSRNLSPADDTWSPPPLAWPPPADSGVAVDIPISLRGTGTPAGEVDMAAKGDSDGEAGWL